MGPWTADEIARARAVPFHLLLQSLGAYCKLDRHFRSHTSPESVRVHVNYGGRDFRFVSICENWVNELVPTTLHRKGGGGAIDLAAAHVTGFDFVRSVKVCLDALASKESS
ncbi:hypothetical protein WJ62_05165 [Burkholderia diffusa]|nr:hypothetical protein WJ62_05165 [Burkholderia diffusa]